MAIVSIAARLSELHGEPLPLYLLWLYLLWLYLSELHGACLPLVRQVALPLLLGHLQLHAQRGRLLAAQQRRVAVELALVRVGVLGLGF